MRLAKRDLQELEEIPPLRFATVGMTKKGASLHSG